MNNRWMPTVVSGLAACLMVEAFLIRWQALLHGNLWALGSLLFYAISFFLYIFRHEAQYAATGFMPWFYALAGTGLPFLITLTHSPKTFFWISLPVEIVGMIVTIMAILSLGRGFGVVAAKRDIKTHGMYRFVRHPLYTGEALWFLAIIIQSLSWINVIIFILQIACQIRRMAIEESLLSRDETYAQYLQTVRYRLIPGIY